MAPNLLIYGILSGICGSLNGNYYWNFLGYQYVYFYLVCRYLKLKVKNYNEQVKLAKSKQLSNIPDLVRSFDRLNNEITEYNKSYLSKFLFIFWFVFASAIVLFLYIVIFVDLPTVVKIVSAYTLLIYFIMFLFTIMTAASINYHARISYSSLNSLFISINKSNEIQSTFQIEIICKVFINLFHVIVN